MIKQKYYCSVCGRDYSDHFGNQGGNEHPPHDFDGDTDSNYAMATWVVSDYEARFDQSAVGDVPTVFVDLLADLMHFAKRHNISMADAYSRALEHFTAAVNGE